MEQIQYEINGIKYLLIEEVLTASNSAFIEGKMTKYECIGQGVKTYDKGGFLSSAFVVIKILVPEKNEFTFQFEKRERTRMDLLLFN